MTAAKLVSAVQSVAWWVDRNKPYERSTAAWVLRRNRRDPVEREQLKAVLRRRLENDYA